MAKAKRKTTLPAKLPEPTIAHARAMVYGGGGGYWLTMSLVAVGLRFGPAAFGLFAVAIPLCLWALFGAFRFVPEVFATTFSFSIHEWLRLEHLMLKLISPRHLGSCCDVLGRSRRWLIPMYAALAVGVVAMLAFGIAPPGWTRPTPVESTQPSFGATVAT